MINTLYFRFCIERLKAHSHQARLRPCTSVDARLRPSTRVDGRKRPTTRVYADMEHMLKSVRVHTKRVYVRLRRVDHPMASDLVARDKVMNIQFIK